MNNTNENSCNKKNRINGKPYQFKSTVTFDATLFMKTAPSRDRGGVGWGISIIWGI
jgi:hypothetical protein